jgi:hypothetical protein
MYKHLVCSACAWARTESRIGLAIATALAFCASQAVATPTGLAKHVTESEAALEPIFHDGLPLPLPRPDIALLYGAETVEITLPVKRPILEDVLPRSTRTLGEMIRQQTGLSSESETILKLKPGEGVGKLLRRAGYSQGDIAAAIDAMAKKTKLRSLPVGLAFTVSENGFVFSTRAGRDIYTMRDPDSGWISLTAIRPVERYMTYANGVIENSIYEAASKANVPDDALLEYIRIMGFSVDFQREIRPGDTFEMLIEREVDMISGDELGTKLHYAGLRLSGDYLGFYRFDQQTKGVGWFDKDGNSAARTLIRTPIAGARLSSSFGMRRHPVSGFNGMHKGVDFSAAPGTPIIAAGSGVIEKAGWLGSYGRYVKIRHNSTYSTAYAHMSRIAKGITPGTRVQQGEVIGYVGSSGRSTGPHLHYEILVNNRRVNPMTVRLPTGEKIDPVLREPFKQRVALVNGELMDGGSTQQVANNMSLLERLMQ